MESVEKIERKGNPLPNRMVLIRKKIGKVPVYLNVNDLTPINGYAYWLGLGVYHSSVQASWVLGQFLQIVHMFSLRSKALIRKLVEVVTGMIDGVKWMLFLMARPTL
ncbi:unnamed protein product [Prunus brigantina]